jgi:hypothetical protein
VARPSPSSLTMLDAVDSFSRMGVAEPTAEGEPAKQWVIAGVNKFFPSR